MIYKQYCKSTPMHTTEHVDNSEEVHSICSNRAGHTMKCFSEIRRDGSSENMAKYFQNFRVGGTVKIRGVRHRDESESVLGRRLDCNYTGLNARYSRAPRQRLT